MSGFEGSYLGDGARIPEQARMECGVCWWVYDPERGDEAGQVPPGTPFAALPEHWCCPRCATPRNQFMFHGAETIDLPEHVPAGVAQGPARDAAHGSALRRQARRLAAAYRAVGERMQDLPVYNPALTVQVIGPRPWNGAAVAVVVTPWCMNLVRLPASDEKARLEGSSRDHEFPSGVYAFLAGRLEGVGPLESCSLFSPMESFDDPAVTRQVAEAALAGLFEAPAPAEPSAVSRRSFLRGATG